MANPPRPKPISALASRGHIAIAAGMLTNELEAAGRFKDAEAVLRRV